MNQLLTGNVWTDLAAFARKNRAPVLAAVPYFGKGGAQQLKLPKGSVLVVNATEGNVKAGAVHPDDLLKLQAKGVRVFHYPSLHAKVYAFPKRAYIGSANVSQSSAGLVEALICTTDAKMLAGAKAFINGLLGHELGPKHLKQLQKLYGKPKGVHAPASQGVADRPSAPRLCIAQLVRTVARTGQELRQDKIGERAAMRARSHTRGWNVESFRWDGANPFKVGDRVIEVLEESPRRSWVSPPRRVLYIHPYGTRGRKRDFVYIERPETDRRKQLDKLTRKMGKGSKSLLATNGLVRSRDKVRRLDEVFNADGGLSA